MHDLDVASNLYTAYQLHCDLIVSTATIQYLISSMWFIPKFLDNFHNFFYKSPHFLYEIKLKMLDSTPTDMMLIDEIQPGGGWWRGSGGGEGVIYKIDSCVHYSVYCCFSVLTVNDLHLIYHLKSQLCSEY